MRKRNSWIVVAVVVVALAAVVWIGGDAIWSWLLAMHGKR